jgi:hypothetical protein
LDGPSPDTALPPTDGTTTGNPSDVTDAAVRVNIVAAGFGR